MRTGNSDHHLLPDAQLPWICGPADSQVSLLHLHLFFVIFFPSSGGCIEIDVMERNNLLFIAVLCATADGFATIQHVVSKTVPFSRTSLAYSPSNVPNEGANGEPSPMGLKSGTALPVSNIFGAEGLTITASPGNTELPSLNSTTTEFHYDFAQLEVTMHSSANTGFGRLVDRVMSSYLGPRLLLACVACLYGTNFPLGSIMDQALPASAATSARMLFAAAALSPFITQLPRELIVTSLLAGCFTAGGYVTQSMALVDTSAATVSFLGAATVIWCPFLEWLLHKTPMGWKDRPQTWISAVMCMLGVGVLELCGTDAANAFGSIGLGDGLAVLQAMGFGTGLFLSEQMMKKHPTKALPITAVMVATSALVSMVWALSDGWMGALPGWESMTLPNMLLDPSMREVAMAVVWTGLLSTSLNFFLEVSALGRVPSGEASVILATEPLWAAAFASVLIGEKFGWNDYTGGLLIVAACIVNSFQASDFEKLFPAEKKAR